MSKKQHATRQKDSNLVVPQNSSEFIFTDDTTCVVNFELSGKFHSRQSNASSKTEKSKMLLSPILDENRKGRFICTSFGAPGRKLGDKEPLPKLYFTSNSEYKPYITYVCTQRRVYNNDALRYLGSDGARPFNIKKPAWDAMKFQARLMAQFAIDATELNPSNPSFTFEFVN